jgi:hypothetical protein
MPHALAWSRPAGRYVILFGAFAVLLFIVEHINGRAWMHDFRVYWGAAQALLHGEAVYGVPHGLDSGVFKYSPMMAFFFAPLALLPYPLASAMHFGAIVTAFLCGALAIDRLLRSVLFGGRPASFAPLFLTGLVVMVHLHRELHLGNINMILLALLVLAIERMLQGRSLLAGLLIGIAVLAKPHFVVLLPLLLLRGQWGVLGSALLTLASGILLPAVVLGWDGNMLLHLEWIEQMAKHNASLIYTGGTSYEAVNTVYSILHRAFLAPLGVAQSSYAAYAMLGVIVVAFGAWLLSNLISARREGAMGSPAFLIELLLLIALVPSITLTDTEHFLLSMPLVALVLHHLLPKATPSWSPWLAVPVLLAYGGNWEDALGPLSDVLVHYGVLGMANMGLLALTLLFAMDHTGRVARPNPRT